MATGDWYGKTLSKLAAGTWSWTTTVKCGLLTASYTPSLNVDAFWSDINTNETTGTGYSAGGIAIASPTTTFTAANSWATAAATSTAYTAGAVVRPSSGNGYLYRCIVSGTSGGSAPTWPTVIGQTVTDGTVTWTTIGTGITVLGCTDPSWSASGGALTARFAAFYYNTGTASTSPLIALVDQGSAVTATNASFTVQADSNIVGFAPLYSS